MREAAALSIIEGARTSVDDVRALSMADDGGAASDPGAALALGIWRSQWNLASRFPALNTRSQGRARVAPTPLPALIAGLHRDTCSGLVAAGLVESRSVAVPADPSLLAPALAYTRADAPGLAVAAALTHLLKNPDEAARIGENGRQAILHTYNWDIELRKLLSCYESL